MWAAGQVKNPKPLADLTQKDVRGVLTEYLKDVQTQNSLKKTYEAEGLTFSADNAFYTPAPSPTVTWYVPPAAAVSAERLRVVSKELEDRLKRVLNFDY